MVSVHIIWMPKMSNDLFSLMMGLDDDDTSREHIVRAPFGYPGSKDRILDRILPYLPYDEAYIEVFGGSGAVILARRPSPIEVFNDRCSGIVALYRCIRDRQKCERLVEWLDCTIHSREEFIFCRDNWEKQEDDIIRAGMFYYLVHNSFGKQGRTFARGTKSKPHFGQSLHHNLALFNPIHVRLINTQIENLDWRTCLKDFDQPKAVFYLDPPFLGVHTKMYRHIMHSYEEHKELLERIFSMKGFVALSAYNNSETKALYDPYPWDDKIVWENHSTAVGLSFDTDTNNLKDRHHEIERRIVEEALYIKEAK